MIWCIFFLNREGFKLFSENNEKNMCKFRKIPISGSKS